MVVCVSKVIVGVEASVPFIVAAPVRHTRDSALTSPVLECSVTAAAAGCEGAGHFWPPRLRFLTTAAEASQLFQRCAEGGAGSGDPRFH